MTDVEGPMSDDENRNLFAEDETEIDDERNNPDDYAVEVPSTQQGTQANETANLDVSTAIAKPKRVIKNPQPKLDPDRIMGPRGIAALEEEFKDWKPRGNGHEFQDLEQVMSKLNHWTHRLYPKLPFDATLNIIENRLGNKKVVQTHVKKIRMGMVGPPKRQDEETNDIDQPEQDEAEQEVERYGEESTNQNSQNDDFDNLAPSHRQTSTQQTTTTSTLTDEQLERMRRNKDMAPQKKREREARKKIEEEEIQQAERDHATQGDQAQGRGDLEQQLDDEEQLMREMEENEREIEDTTTRLNTECTIDPQPSPTSTSTTDISRSEAPSAASEWPVTSQDQEKTADSTEEPVENAPNDLAENAPIESVESPRQLEPEKEKNPAENCMNIDEIMDDMDDVMEEDTRG